MKTKIASGDEQRGKSLALRLVIHYVGDCHQPMHTTARVNKEFPSGDKGGNDFNLTNRYSIDNLHALWDSVLYEFRTNDKLPYDQAGWAKLGESVKKLTSRFTLSPNDYSTINIKSWIQDGFGYAQKEAYNGITQNNAVPNSYIDNNNNFLAKQLVLAGHRLAQVIKTIYGKP